jgi:amino-acid N-acetyltransferase
MNAIPQPNATAEVADSEGSEPPIDGKESQFVRWFRTAAPYIHQFHEKTFVIAFGGEVLEDGEFMDLAHDINVLVALGVRLVLVHGARPQIEDQLRQHGVAPKYFEGKRVTDDAALKCVKEANGIVRVEIEALLSTELANSPMAESDIRVSSGNFVSAKPLGVIQGVDYGHTGQVRKVDVEGIQKRLDDNEVVLISPIGFSATGSVFNLTMEDVATSISTALKSDKLVFLMETHAVQDAQGVDQSELTAKEAEACFAGLASPPEDVKLFVPAAIRAVQNGVKRAHLISRHTNGSVLLELFTHHGIGTMIVPQPPEVIRKAQLPDVEGIYQLIEPLAQRGVLVHRSAEQLAETIQDYVVLELTENDENKIIGCCALHPFMESNTAELACLAVNPFYRDGGRGEWILQAVEKVAKEKGYRSIFILSTQTFQWFIERGFYEAPLEWLPEQKRATYNHDRRSKIFVKKIV